MGVKGGPGPQPQPRPSPFKPIRANRGGAEGGPSALSLGEQQVGTPLSSLEDEQIEKIEKSVLQRVHREDPAVQRELDRAWKKPEEQTLGKFPSLYSLS